MHRLHSLPDFPTLLSVEGDFLIKAGSIHRTHNTFNNRTQSRRKGQKGGGSGERNQSEKGSKEDLEEAYSGKRQNKHTGKYLLALLLGEATSKKHVLPLVGPLRDPMACCSSDTLSRRTTSAKADFNSWISSSCIWTLCSREAMRSVTSILLAADALSSEETQRARQGCENYTVAQSGLCCNIKY